MNDDEPDGYAMPLRTSLTRPILLGGVPRAFAILNATIGAAIGFGLQQPFIGLPLWAVLQGAAAWAAARDPCAAAGNCSWFNRVAMAPTPATKPP